VAGTSGSTKPVWGLLEQDSFYGRLRRFIVSCMTYITNILQPIQSTLIISYYAIPDIPVPTETGDKLTPTQGRGFPGFLSGMHARHMRMIIIISVFISNSMEITIMHSCI
jgi:hypothetical protein